MLAHHRHAACWKMLGLSPGDYSLMLGPFVLQAMLLVKRPMFHLTCCIAVPFSFAASRFCLAVCLTAILALVRPRGKSMQCKQWYHVEACMHCNVICMPHGSFYQLSPSAIASTSCHHSMARTKLMNAGLCLSSLS